MKRYYPILLLCAVLIMLPLPLNARQEKVLSRTAQKRGAIIDTATWQEFDLGAYTFERRLPLTVKLPATTRLNKEMVLDGFYYYMYLNPGLVYNVVKIFNKGKTVAESMAETRKIIGTLKQYGMSYKLLIDEPEVFLLAVNSKKSPARFHLLVVHIGNPEEGVHYRFENVAFGRPDIYSDAEWIQMARSLQASKVQ